ncbi:MAG: hypothetical protein IKB02_04370 [Clostridia bacterium]|nr:hypothetical protein [Clostridia bacterium]
MFAKYNPCAEQSEMGSHTGKCKGVVAPDAEHRPNGFDSAPSVLRSG